jgi:hypothetical protein
MALQPMAETWVRGWKIPRRRSRASLRRPQSVSLRSGLKTHSTCRFSALNIPMRARITMQNQVQQKTAAGVETGDGLYSGHDTQPVRHCRRNL